jgi:heme A synthase
MIQVTKPPSSRLFTTLALVTALLTIGLIVFGAVVRVTDSGLGCGNHWPLCNGTIFPPLDNITAWIEWLHRLFAALIGLFGLGTLGVALRAYRRQNQRALGLTVLAATLFMVQSLLGALTVKTELNPTLVTLHLGTAMLLLGALLSAVVVSYPSETHYRSDMVTTLIYTTTALSFVVILIGGLVRGSGATLACVDWPLCNGQVLPFSQGQLATIHMTHRFAVAALGITLLILAWYVYRARQNARMRTLAVLAVVVFFAQAGVGAMYVLTSGAALWGAAHVGLAATTWALLLVLSMTEWMNTRVGEEVTWKTQSQASL